MEITQMTRAHVAQIAALEGQCFADPWSERSVASELENPLSLWLVALEDGTVAGYVGSQSVLGEADMMNLAVAPAYRRRGVARALLAALEQALDARLPAGRPAAWLLPAPPGGCLDLKETMEAQQ